MNYVTQLPTVRKPKRKLANDKVIPFEMAHEAAIVALDDRHQQIEHRHANANSQDSSAGVDCKVRNDQAKA
jgi:hypothetical protein